MKTKKLFKPNWPAIIVLEYPIFANKKIVEW